MTTSVADVMSQLKSMGSAQTRKTLAKHGAPANLFGVKVADLKKIQKKVKTNQHLAEELFATGNGDAMYLAGMIADPETAKLGVMRKWVKATTWSYICEYAVAGVAAESPHGWKLGLEWVDSATEHVASSGWNTLSGVLSLRADEELDLKKINSLLSHIKKHIHKAPNRVRYTMNGFVIAVGSYVVPLSEKAREIAEAIGKVEVDLIGSCKLPHAPDYIDKVVKAGRVGKKRKKARC